jgi:hypothetical protein
MTTLHLCTEHRAQVAELLRNLCSNLCRNLCSKVICRWSSLAADHLYSYSDRSANPRCSESQACRLSGTDFEKILTVFCGHVNAGFFRRSREASHRCSRNLRMPAFMTALQQQLCETSHYDSLCNGPGVKRKFLSQTAC